ncbi:Flp family type IVb pilin [Magnetovibrio sp.]|uniref:Flp family type IVb pilin n=1 Tax=Magnetovibrio sp. TaxID=2024836 RepID=UPI002F934447
MMTGVWARAKTFCRNEDGVTAIEYGVIIVMISGSLLFALPLLGSNIYNPLNELASAIDNGGGGASSGDDSEGSDNSDDSGDDGHGDDDDDHGDDDEGDDDHEHDD